MTGIRIPDGRRTKLNVSAAGVLNAAGGLVLQLPGPGAGERWEVTRLTILVTDSAGVLADDPMPRAYLYDGDAVPTNVLDSTYVGAQNASDFATPHVLEPDEYLTLEWTGGLAGARAAATIAGARVTV